MSLVKVNGVMLIAVIALGVGFLGWVLPGISVHRISRTGSGTCTTSAITGTCGATVTYSSPLTSAPCTGCYSLTFVNPTAPTTVLTVLSTGTFFAVQSAGIIWTNMPAGPTEIFGDTGQHWITLDMTRSNQVRFCVNLVTAGIGIGEILNAQYSIDAGVTWNTQGAGVTVDATFPPGIYCEAYSSLPASAKIANVIWRIIGTNGAGVGDNPAFSIAYEQLSYGQSFASTWSTSFSGTPTATGAIITIRITALVAQSETVNYQVYICSDGSSTC